MTYFPLWHSTPKNLHLCHRELLYASGWFQTPYPIISDCKTWLRISRFKARCRKIKGTWAFKSGRRFKFGRGHILAAMLFWTSYLLSDLSFHIWKTWINTQPRKVTVRTENSNVHSSQGEAELAMWRLWWQWQQCRCKASNVDTELLCLSSPREP